jgi:pre-mRNA-splicing factor ATP-dependent RNA helicase DHX38/PRP16
VEGSPLSSDRNDEITEEMMQEMDYSADRAWYDLMLSYRLIV